MATPDSRDCKDCQQCCVIFEVDGIDKKERENCPFLESGVGCTIYADRPDNCKRFECTWIQGLGDDEDNPKTCGVLIMKRGSNLMHNGRKLQYVAWETFKDAYKRESALQAMARVSEETGNKIIMMEYGNRSILSLCKGDGVD